MLRFFRSKKQALRKRYFKKPFAGTFSALTLAVCLCAILTLALTVNLIVMIFRPAPKKDTTSSFPETSCAADPTAFEQADPLEAFFDEYGCAADQPITPEEAAASLNALREVFPEGAYWNHIGVEEWDEFTVTDIPCMHDIYGYLRCNTYSGSLQEFFPQFDPLKQCLGFASLLSDLVFGEDAPVKILQDATDLRPGDHIRLELTEHSMIVLTVEEEGITVVECNSDYEHCRISWDRFLDWEELSAYSYEMECITRYETS